MSTYTLQDCSFMQRAILFHVRTEEVSTSVIKIKKKVNFTIPLTTKVSNG